MSRIVQSSFLSLLGIILFYFSPPSYLDAKTSIWRQWSAPGLSKFKLSSSLCHEPGTQPQDGAPGQSPGHSGWKRWWGGSGLGALVTEDQLPPHSQHRHGLSSAPSCGVLAVWGVLPASRPPGFWASSGCSEASSLWPISLDCVSP